MPETLQLQAGSIAKYRDDAGGIYLVSIVSDTCDADGFRRVLLQVIQTLHPSPDLGALSYGSRLMVRGPQWRWPRWRLIEVPRQELELPDPPTWGGKNSTPSEDIAEMDRRLRGG